MAGSRRRAGFRVRRRARATTAPRSSRDAATANATHRGGAHAWARHDVCGYREGATKLHRFFRRPASANQRQTQAAGPGIGCCSHARRSSSVTARSGPGRAAVSSRAWFSFFAVGRVGENGADGVADRGRRSLSRNPIALAVPSATHVRIERLVGVDRNDDQRQSEAEGCDDGAEAGVADHEVAVGEQQALRDVALDANAGSLRAELAGVAVAAER